MSGARDKKIYAYSVNDGSLLWEDQLPFVAYGCPIIAKTKKNMYLIAIASGGAKFSNVKNRDVIVSYKLK